MPKLELRDTIAKPMETHVYGIRPLGAIVLFTTPRAVVYNTIAPKRTNAMDMRFHWLCDRIAQLQFRHYWMPGPYNKGDYVTKHHAPAHHIANT